jgi:hypothetical protein
MARIKEEISDFQSACKKASQGHPLEWPKQDLTSAPGMEFMTFVLEIRLF